MMYFCIYGKRLKSQHITNPEKEHHSQKIPIQSAADKHSSSFSKYWHSVCCNTLNFCKYVSHCNLFDFHQHNSTAHHQLIRKTFEVLMPLKLNKLPQAHISEALDGVCHENLKVKLVSLSIPRNVTHSFHTWRELYILSVQDLCKFHHTSYFIWCPSRTWSCRYVLYKWHSGQIRH